jgi:hypothetical protein
MLTPQIQAEFVADAPDVFLPVAGGWGRMGATHIRLAKADHERDDRRAVHRMEAAVSTRTPRTLSESAGRVPQMRRAARRFKMSL